MISIISCGAPEVSPFSHRLQDFSETEMLEVIRLRMLCIFAIASNFNVENIVLGAWGCGAFANDPHVIATCFFQLLEREKLRYLFKHVVFAIPPGDNFDVFYKVLKDLTDDSNVFIEK